MLSVSNKRESCFVQLDKNAEKSKKAKTRLPPLSFRQRFRIFGVRIIHLFKENSKTLDKVLSFISLCFYFRCTDRNVWIASNRPGVFFVRGRPSRSTAAVKRSKDKRQHLSVLVVPQDADISLTGKYIVSQYNLVVSVAGQDMLIVKLKRNIHLLLNNSKKYRSSLRSRD